MLLYHSFILFITISLGFKFLFFGNDSNVIGFSFIYSNNSLSVILSFVNGIKNISFSDDCFILNDLLKYPKSDNLFLNCFTNCL